MGFGVAGLLLGASSCDCCNPVQPVQQPTYACPDGSAVYCLRAQEALGSFLGSYTEVPGTQVATGETVQRLFSRGPFGGGGVDIEGLNILSDWAITWDDACAVEMIVDYYAATGDPTFNRIVEAYKRFEPLYFLGSSLVNPNDNPLGITGFPRYNSYNDDLLWWALAFVHAYENVPAPADSGSVRDLTYLRNAEAVFQSVCAQWNAAPGCAGGVTQTQNGTYENTVTNALLFELAVKLYMDDPPDSDGKGVMTGNDQRCAVPPLTAYRGPGATCGPGDEDAGVARDAEAGDGGGSAPALCSFTNDYLGFALAEYEWFVLGPRPGASLLEAAALAGEPVHDAIGTPAEGCLPEGDFWSYNSGVLLGALFDLSRLPAEKLTDPPEVVLARAWNVGNAAMAYFSSSDAGPALAERTNESCDGNVDCPEFKGIFIRYLARVAYGSVPSDFTGRAQALIQKNAEIVWGHQASMGVPFDCRSGFLDFDCEEEAGVVFPLDWNGTGPGVGPSYEPATTSAIDALIAAIPTPSPIFLPPVPGGGGGGAGDGGR